MSQSLLRRSKNISLDPRYGKPPSERELRELLEAGFVILDKPMGPTSHQVTSWVRDMLSVDKGAHGGTLDPRVSGVLPVGLGTAVRAMDYLHDAVKRYVGVMRIHGDVDDKSLEAVARDFTGEIFQMPPVRSGVKRVRRIRRIHSFDILERDGREVLFDVKCDGGTYIRTLCADIGDALAVGAHMQDLRRVEAGGFNESEAFSLHELKDAVESSEGDTEPLKKIVRPMEDIFCNWKRIMVKDSAVDALCHGANLAIPGIAELSSNISHGDKIAIFTLKGEIVAVSNALKSSKEMMREKDGFAVELERVLMKASTYPKVWSSSAKKE